MKPELHPMLRCIHCGWETPTWTTTRGGRRSSGWHRLEVHIFDAHGIDVDLIGEVDDERQP